jgi:hypothetical protein
MIELPRALELLEDLLNAIDPFLADQSGATDSRCGLVQPVTVSECETLNVVVAKARKHLEQHEEEPKGIQV